MLSIIRLSRDTFLIHFDEKATDAGNSEDVTAIIFLISPFLFGCCPAYSYQREAKQITVYPSKGPSYNSATPPPGDTFHGCLLLRTI